MSYYPILKTTWKYFPEKKGFLTGLILCVFGYCPFVFTSIADAVINPDGLPADKDSGLFLDETIAIRMKNFSLIMFITMGVCGVLSQFLMFPLDNIVSTDGGQTVVEKEDNTNDNKHSYVSNEIETNNNPVEPDPEEESKNAINTEIQINQRTNSNIIQRNTEPKFISTNSLLNISQINKTVTSTTYHNNNSKEKVHRRF